MRDFNQKWKIRPLIKNTKTITKILPNLMAGIVFSITLFISIVAPAHCNVLVIGQFVITK